MRKLATALPVTALAAGLLTAGAGSAPAVVGGSTAAQTNWMVQVHVTRSDGSVRICGGAAVAGNKVLTAASCVTDGTTVRVASGTNALLPEAEMRPGATEMSYASTVSRVWTHPGYDAATGRNDLALLTTSRPLIGFSSVPLATPEDTASYTPGTVGTFYGWGSTSGTSDQPADSLRTAGLTIGPDSDCSTPLGTAWAPGRMFCAGGPATGEDAGTVAPCTGDGGGPLIVNGRLVGVYSRGTGPTCTSKDSHAVFTKVDAFLGDLNNRINDTSLNGDGLADLFTMTPNGQRFEYDSTGGGFLTRKALGPVAKPYNRYRQADLNRDGFQDYVYRTSTGDLYQSYDVAVMEGWGNWIVDRYETKIGTRWGGVRSIALPGDVTGDRTPDLVVIDSSGIQWVYPFKTGGRGLAPRIKSGTGWSGYTLLGSGDWTGDGRTDLLARDTAGRLWLYKGTGRGSAPWQTRVRIGTGWNYTAYITPGDTTGDAHPDLLTRDSAGYLWLYRGTGNAGAPLQSRVRLGLGWNIYSLIS